SQISQTSPSRPWSRVLIWSSSAPTTSSNSSPKLPWNSTSSQPLNTPMTPMPHSRPSPSWTVGISGYSSGNKLKIRGSTSPSATASTVTINTGSNTSTSHWALSPITSAASTKATTSCAQPSVSLPKKSGSLKNTATCSMKKPRP